MDVLLGLGVGTVTTLIGVWLTYRFALDGAEKIREAQLKVEKGFEERLLKARIDGLESLIKGLKGDVQNPNFKLREGVLRQVIERKTDEAMVLELELMTLQRALYGKE